MRFCSRRSDLLGGRALFLCAQGAERKIFPDGFLAFWVGRGGVGTTSYCFRGEGTFGGGRFFSMVSFDLLPGDSCFGQLLLPFDSVCWEAAVVCAREDHVVIGAECECDLPAARRVHDA